MTGQNLTGRNLSFWQRCWQTFKSPWTRRYVDSYIFTKASKTSRKI